MQPRLASANGCADPHAFVVEDDVRIRKFLADILTSEGFTSHEFSKIAEIEAGLTQWRPEIVVMDLSLGGTDAVEGIRSLAAARFVGRILLISGHDQATIAEVNRIGERYGLLMLQPLHKPRS